MSKNSDLKKIKFKEAEEKCIQKIRKDGSITIAGFNKSENNAIKNLYFQDLIERRPPVVNVYFLTIMGEKIVEWNESVEAIENIINGNHKV